jgi:hypothetical protein
MTENIIEKVRYHLQVIALRGTARMKSVTCLNGFISLKNKFFDKLSNFDCFNSTVGNE